MHFDYVFSLFQLIGQFLPFAELLVLGQVQQVLVLFLYGQQLGGLRPVIVLQASVRFLHPLQLGLQRTYVLRVRSDHLRQLSLRSLVFGQRVSLPSLRGFQQSVFRRQILFAIKMFTFVSRLRISQNLFSLGQLTFICARATVNSSCNCLTRDIWSPSAWLIFSNDDASYRPIVYNMSMNTIALKKILSVEFYLVTSYIPDIVNSWFRCYGWENLYYIYLRYVCNYKPTMHTNILYFFLISIKFTLFTGLNSNYRCLLNN